ncbi:hypothetical protein [Methanobrevibacter curvatus]|nr:hypothetical protein [Methanobrevibacter curvatus]
MPLVHDKEDPKCNLLDLIFIDIDSRETRQKLSRNGIKPANTAVNAIKIRVISMFYRINIKYVVNEINKKEELRNNFKFNSTLDYNQLSEIFSRFDELQILEFTLKTIK